MDHLSRLDQDGLRKLDDGIPISESFHGEHILNITSKELPWFADIANYLVSGILPYGMDYRQKKSFYMTAGSTIGRSHYFTKGVPTD